MSREEAIEELSSRKSALSSQLALMRSRSAEELRLGTPVHFGSCRLSDTRRSDFEEYVATARLSERQAQDLRDRAVRKVGPPPLETRELLESIDVTPLAPDLLAGPSWVSYVCRNRGLLQSCVFSFDRPHSPLLCKFAFARQSPMLAVFARVVQVANDVPPCSASESRLPEFVYWEHAFRPRGLEVFFTGDGPIDHAWRPSVLPDCFYQQEGLLVSDADWCSL